jgi:hypothetical protein
MNKSKGLGVKIFILVIGIASFVMGVKNMSVNSSALIGVEAQVVSVSKELADDSGTSSYTVTYKYAVNGVDYQDDFSSYSEVPQGEKVTVYYDPKSPAESYQSQGESKSVGVMGVILGIVCVGGIGWEAIKSKRKSTKETETPPAIQN